MLKRMTGQAGRKQLANIAMLIGGYGLGQGSLFLSQTWLVVKGDLDLLAFFGTNFAFAVLAAVIVDAGSYIVLARHTVHRLSEGDTWPEIWRCYWETSVFRLVMAGAIASVAVVLFLFLGADEETVGFALWFAPALLVWSFNGTGLIDGLNLSGVSGLSGALPYIAAAAALFGCYEFSVTRPGAVLGGAIFIGYAGTVAVQFLTLSALGKPPHFVRPTKAGVKRAMTEGLQLTSSQIPGQLYFRAQLLLSNSFLGADATALFIYGKQIVTAFNQVISFVRRTEFPNLVAKLSQAQDNLLQTVFRVQRLGNYLSVVMAIAVLLAGLAMSCYAGGETARAGYVLVLFAPTIVTTTLLMALQQAMAAVGNYGALSKYVAFAMLTGLAVAVATIDWLGLVGLALADLVQHATNIWLTIAHIRNKQPWDEDRHPAQAVGR